MVNIKTNVCIRSVWIQKLVTQINKKKSNPCPFCKGKKVITEDNLHDGVFKLTIPCVTCNASGINDEGLKEVVEGVDVQTWLTGKVSDVVNESLLTEAVGQIPILIAYVSWINEI